jgi:hypothetical protein
MTPSGSGLPEVETLKSAKDTLQPGFEVVAFLLELSDLPRQLRELGLFFLHPLSEYVALLPNLLVLGQKAIDLRFQKFQILQTHTLHGLKYRPKIGRAARAVKQHAVVDGARGTRGGA